MNEPAYDRIQNDLTALRQAVGLELPFGWLDVWGNLWVAACGLLLALYGLLEPWQYRPVLSVPLGLLVLGWMYCVWLARKQRAQRPSIWREHKMACIAVLVIVPLVVAYIRWEDHLGVSKQVAGGAALFFTGVGLLLVSIADRRRLCNLPGAACLMALGAVFPLLDVNQILAAAGLCGITNGLAEAAIQGWQLRRRQQA